MAQELQNNQVSSTTTDIIIFGETSKFTYPKSAKEFCITCQDLASVLGHSSINCPETICLNCLQHGLTVKGHNATVCLRPTRYWPDKSQTGINPYKKCTYPNLGIIPEIVSPKIGVQKTEQQ